MEKFNFSDDIQNCYFTCSRYNANDNLALMIENDEGPVCCCTVNMNEKVADDQVCIKDWSENERVPGLLIELGIIEDEPVDEIWNEFVGAPVFNLTDKGKQVFRENLSDYKL